jgi:dTDP-4-dehydrorhamnose 3,5-epimerase
MIIKEFFGLKGVYEIELESVKDFRGEFKRTYDDTIFDKYCMTKWVQENHSISFKKNTIRGLHFQFPPHTETKLVRSVKGEILDVFVDIRKDSETFGKWGSIILSETNNKAILIPRGFAHGFRTLTDDCQILYKVDNYYSPKNESGIRWDDPHLNIDWKFDSEEDKNNILISKKDINLPYLKFEMEL